MASTRGVGNASRFWSRATRYIDRQIRLHQRPAARVVYGHITEIDNENRIVTVRQYPAYDTTEGSEIKVGWVGNTSPPDSYSVDLWNGTEVVREQHSTIGAPVRMLVDSENGHAVIDDIIVRVERNPSAS